MITNSTNRHIVEQSFTGRPGVAQRSENLAAQRIDEPKPARQEHKLEPVSSVQRPGAVLADKAESIPQHSATCPVIQRVPEVSTWAGRFVVEKYNAVQGEDEDTKETNGATVTVKFKPNAFVDAMKIAFVQNAQSLIDGKPANIYERNILYTQKAKEVAKKRMVPGGQPGEGAHIDAEPSARTPLYSMKDPPGNDLSDPQPVASKDTQIGWNFIDAKGKRQNGEAMFHDQPTLTVPKGKGASQTFETAALAVSGNQDGVFYGSVEWGWKMGPTDTEAKVIDFVSKSKDSPSPVFGEAAKLWNSTKISGIGGIEIPNSMRVTSEVATLWDSPGNSKKIGTLAEGTRLGLAKKSEPKNPILVNVVVVSGPLKGKAGWVPGRVIVTGETAKKPKKEQVR